MESSARRVPYFSYAFYILILIAFPQRTTEVVTTSPISFLPSPMVVASVVSAPPPPKTTEGVTTSPILFPSPPEVIASIVSAPPPQRTTEDVTASLLSSSLDHPLPSSPATNFAATPLLSFSPWEQVLALAWSPDGKLLAVSAGESIHLYEAGTDRELLALKPGFWSPALAFSPDGRWLASGSRDGSARIWDPSSGELIRTLSGHPKGINSLSFSRDGSWLATSGDDAIVRVWSLSSGEIIAKLIGGVFAVPAVAFSQDGSLLASADGRNLRLREVTTQRLANTLRLSPGDEGPSFFTLAYSPDGRVLASGDTGNGVQLWDAASGKLRRALTGHAGSPERVSGLVWEVAFSPDGQRLASASGDNTVRLWDASSGDLLTTFRGHSLAATSLAFSPDGHWLASGSLDGTVRLWEID